MSWKGLLDQRRVDRQSTTREEIESQTDLAARAIADASVEGLSDDGRFERAYDAARALATVVVRASGYRVKQQGGAHYSTFLALEAADDARLCGFSSYFNLCREKRNDLSYVAPGLVSRSETDELVREVRRFQLEVQGWLRAKYPALG